MDNKTVSLKGEDVLILTECFYEDGTISYQEQLLLYKTLADYLLPGKNLWVKRAENDFTEYKQLIGAEQVAGRTVKISDLPAILQGKGECCVTVSKKEIKELQKNFESTLVLGEDYVYSWKKAARYFGVLALLSHLYSTIPEIVLENVDASYFQAMASRRFQANSLCIRQEEQGKIPPGTICISDREIGEADRDAFLQAIENMPENSILVRLNPSGLDAVYDRSEKKISYPFHPVAIQRIQQGMEKESVTECIYIFTKNEENRKAMKEFELREDSKHLQETVMVKPLDEKDIRIKALEGILEATENRLLYYIEQCNDLKKEQDFPQKGMDIQMGR